MSHDQDSSPPLRIGQSADPDDAFMAWGLAEQLARHGLRAEIEFDDIETLNRRAVDGDLDLTALSVGAYPAIADRYRILRSGASFGDEYGPLVVARADRHGGRSLEGLTIGIPGTMTSARLLLRIFAGSGYHERPMPFDRIVDAVLDGEVDAGLIIHEGQLVYEQLGLVSLFEPALEWAREEQLPLPLGVVGVRRDLPTALQETLAQAFVGSVHAAFQEPELAYDFAARYARGLDRETLMEYVDRYVNAATLDMGDAGARAIERLFERCHAIGLIDRVPRLDLL